MTYLAPLKRFCSAPPVYGLNVPAEQYVDSGTRFLRTTDIGTNGTFNAAGGVYLHPDDVPSDYVLRDGDLLLSRSGTLGRALCVETSGEMTTHAGYLVRFRPGPESFARYLWYCAQSHLMQDAIGADAIQSTIGNFNAEKYANVRLPWWPHDEQRAIADYLDRETARIDALISAKQRAILLYRERRQSLRDNAFDSVPGFRLKRVLRSGMAYGVLVPEFVDDGPRVPMIRTYNLTARGTVDREDIAEIPLSLANQYRRTCLEEGDLILSVVGSMGRAAVAGPREVGSNLNRPLARLQPRAELSARLLWHWTQTTHFMDSAMLATGGGTAQPTLNLGDLANFTVGLPADERVWRQILSMLEAGCRMLDRLEDTALSQTALLQERRQALVTAAVAGHIDVSVAA